jgi:4-alpha-glucanotransferase
LAELSQNFRRREQSLYLDLPLGVNGGGYEVWRERDIFAPGLAVGAPPDTVFLGGQNWGFPPLNPAAQRQQGYRYFIESIRHNMRHAGLLRLDHVMGLHRLFLIPDGMQPADGVYVRYPADELYAILCLESHRNVVAVIGEDLGTVPSYVQTSLARHGINRMFVIEYEASAERKPPLPRPPKNAIASSNTHDIPTFAAFYRGLDIDTLQGLGVFSDDDAERNRQKRQALKEALIGFLDVGTSADESEIYDALMAFLAASPARYVLLNLEDLWQETGPQNIPGTTSEHENWRRKLRYSLEALAEDENVTSRLQALDILRKQT